MPIELDPKKDYPSYPKAELAFPLSTVHVEGVSAVFHRCLPSWRIKQRIVPDDMFFYFVSGRASFKVGGRGFSGVQGDCLHLPRNVPQSAKADPNDPPAVIVIHYHARSFGGIPLATLAGFPFLMRIRDRPLIASLLDEACREFLHRPIGWREGLNAKVWELLLYLLRYHGAELANSTATDEWRHLARIQPALQKMEETLPEPPTIAALARACGYSEAQFRRVFRRAVGLPPVAYLRRRRIEESCLLLRDTDLKIWILRPAWAMKTPASSGPPSRLSWAKHPPSTAASPRRSECREKIVELLGGCKTEVPLRPSLRDRWT